MGPADGPRESQLGLGYDRIQGALASLDHTISDQTVGNILRRNGIEPAPTRMILYPEFAAHGWQIGSGPTESRCKTTTHRLKGRGRRWNRRNAEAVAALTTLTDSQPWTAYWQLPS